jgi:hypothetical protein
VGCRNRANKLFFFKYFEINTSKVTKKEILFFNIAQFHNLNLKQNKNNNEK